MANFRSKFEAEIARRLKRSKIDFQYEPERFPYTQPAKQRKYTPDFRIPAAGVYVESKGRLTKDDRDKLVWIKEAYPELHLIVLFQNAQNPIRKGSKTRYCDWADKVGIEWYDWTTNNKQFLERIK